MRLAVIFSMLMFSAVAFGETVCLRQINEGRSTATKDLLEVVCSDKSIAFQTTFTNLFPKFPIYKQRWTDAMSRAEEAVVRQGYKQAAEFQPHFDWISLRTLYVKAGQSTQGICEVTYARNAVPGWNQKPGTTYALNCKDGAVTTFKTENTAVGDDTEFLNYMQTKGFRLLGNFGAGEKQLGGVMYFQLGQ